MFDIGWTELLLIGIVALIVVGPKDLPVLFRKAGQFMGRARGMAREFSRAMESAADETGMKDAANTMRDLANPRKMGLDALNQATEGFRKWQPDGATGSATGKLAEERSAATAAARASAAASAAARAAQGAAGDPGAVAEPDPAAPPVAQPAAGTQSLAVPDIWVAPPVASPEVASPDTASFDPSVEKTKP